MPKNPEPSPADSLLVWMEGQIPTDIKTKAEKTGIKPYAESGDLELVNFAIDEATRREKAKRKEGRGRGK